MTFVLLQHGKIGIFVQFHPVVGLRINVEKKENLAEPDVIHSELKIAIRDFWQQDEHHVLRLAMDAANSICPIRKVG